MSSISLSPFNDSIRDTWFWSRISVWNPILFDFRFQFFHLRFDQLPVTFDNEKICEPFVSEYAEDSQTFILADRREIFDLFGKKVVLGFCLKSNVNMEVYLSLEIFTFFGTFRNKRTHSTTLWIISNNMKDSFLINGQFFEEFGRFLEQKL